MKLTAQEEYGLRCLIQIARRAPDPEGSPVCIRDVAEAEGLSLDYAAKLLRVLRQSGLVTSERGVNGGFRLSRPTTEISVAEILACLDTPLYGGDDFCQAHSGRRAACVHTQSCSLKALWCAIEGAVARVLGQLTLSDLLLSRGDIEQKILTDRGSTAGGV